MNLLISFQLHLLVVGVSDAYNFQAGNSSIPVVLIFYIAHSVNILYSLCITIFFMTSRILSFLYHQTLFLIMKYFVI